MLNIEILSKQGQTIGIFESQQGVFHIVFEDYRYRYDKDVLKEVDCDEIGCVSHEAYRCANYCKGRIYVCFGEDQICRVINYAHDDDCDPIAEKINRLRRVILKDLINRAISSNNNDLKEFKEEFNKANDEFQLEHKQELAKWDSFMKSINRAKASSGKSKHTIPKSRLYQIIPCIAENQDNNETTNNQDVGETSSEFSDSKMQTESGKNQKRKSTQMDNEKQKRKPKKVFQAHPGYINDSNTSTTSTTESDEPNTLIDQKNASDSSNSNPIIPNDAATLTKNSNENEDNKETSKVRRRKLKRKTTNSKRNESSNESQPHESQTVNQETVTQNNNDSESIITEPLNILLNSSPIQKKPSVVLKTVDGFGESEDGCDDVNDVLHSIGIINTSFNLFDDLDNDKKERDGDSRNDTS